MVAIAYGKLFTTQAEKQESEPVFLLGHHWRKSISITRFIDSIDLVGSTALQRSCEHITQCYRSRVCRR